MRVIALIPAYNEATTIAEVIKRTKPFVDRVIVIDDGSSDETKKIAKESGAYVVSHSMNRGLGAAIGTGMEVAKRLNADVAVTLDADGQHDPSEIPRFVDALEEGAEMVVGSRMLTRTGMPWYRQVANFLGNIVTFILFGMWVTDSQSGFRAFSRRALEQLEVRTNRMAVSSELIAQAKQKRLRFAEIPIRAIYTTYSLSKGQNFFVGLKTLGKLVLRRFM